MMMLRMLLAAASSYYCLLPPPDVSHTLQLLARLAGHAGKCNTLTHFHLTPSPSTIPSPPPPLPPLSGPVNCVSWRPSPSPSPSPSHVQLLASASDDCTLRM